MNLNRRLTTTLLCCLGLLFGIGAIIAAPIEVQRQQLSEEIRFTLQVHEPASGESLLILTDSFFGGTFWDLRSYEKVGQRRSWSVMQPIDAGLSTEADRVGAELALCPEDFTTRDACRLLDSSGELDQPLWTPKFSAGLRWESTRPAMAPLRLGDRHLETARDDSGVRIQRRQRVVAEGLLVTGMGPAEVLLVETRDLRDNSAPTSYLFLDRQGRALAGLTGRPGADGFVVDKLETLQSFSPEADNLMTIDYQTFSNRLTPGRTGFLQYTTVNDTVLSAIHPAWIDIPTMIATDASNVVIQPDGDDPGSQVTLPEVWEFGALDTAVLNFRTFNSTRDDQAGAPCFANCTTRDVTATPPDGTWQAYLKIATYDDLGTLYTEDFFALNDNDTGANPSIDVPFTGQDVLNASDRTQVCFEQSAGGADRFLRFFQFTGPDNATATMGVGDVWNSGNWPSCNDGNGLRLTAASQCGDQCYPGCTIPQPRAQGQLAGNSGFQMTVLEDGFVHVPAGNYLPSLLMRQDTDLIAGLDFIVSCALGSTPNRTFDFFWVNDTYGLLASVSSSNNDTITGTDWSANGNTSDGADFTWGPFPPVQMTADACLSGTRVDWSLPDDGSNLNGEPNIANYGYVVSWGTETTPEALADWTGNPNHSPLPGEGGYLSAPAGSEPTSYVISGWGGSDVRATVTTAIDYTDPDILDVTTFQSGAFYQILEDPARLDGVTFRVGDGVTPFTAINGGDIDLSWNAVAGADAYLITVYDLDTDLEIPCPAGMDCSPSTATATHVGGVAAGNLAYRAFAVDACGEASGN
ncbi:MAG: hypothetical protein OEV00_07080 [Acidobacteriota bacterium]|nr:hypothetical protein [Acidobacteriota bacterium]MDH3785075.1 hypothetical protein [Acidobacteriota bacterium]